jgi:hypothetical protein
MTIPSQPKTFIPVAGDPLHKKFVLDIDSIQLDGDEMLHFPLGTSVGVATEFIERYLITEVGEFPYTVYECRGDSIVYAIFDPPLSPEIRDEIEDAIIDLSNSLRKTA